ncbi:creatininase family protein [Kitasatospora sp. NPDC048545]|uniref:creatininase family protein n=1 Tax=Kitasatospora sp. NPDC048545 TaxID=3157208 RepID=UPI0033EBC45B
MASGRTEVVVPVRLFFNSPGQESNRPSVHRHAEEPDTIGIGFRPTGPPLSRQGSGVVRHGAPELIREGIAQDDHSAPERPYLLTLGMAGYTKNGIIGHPSLGTAAKGKALLDSLSQSAAAHLSLIAGG